MIGTLTRYAATRQSRRSRLLQSVDHTAEADLPADPEQDPKRHMNTNNPDQARNGPTDSENRTTYVWSTTGSNIVGTGDTRLLAADLERIHRKGGTTVGRLYRLDPTSSDLEPLAIRCTNATETAPQIHRYTYTITTTRGVPVEQFDVRVNKHPATPPTDPPQAANTPAQPNPPDA